MRERRIIVTTSLVLALAMSSCSQPPLARPMTLPDTLAFDDSLHRLYVYGHRIRSPLVLAYEDGQLVINGLRPDPVVPDTTGREAQAAALYKRVSYIHRRHEHGLTDVQASREYYDRVYRSVRLALAEYKRAEQEGDSNPVWRARMVLDTAVIDARSKFSIDGRNVLVTERDMGEEFFEGFGGPVRKPSPAVEESDRRARVFDRAQEIRNALQRDGASLEIITRGSSMGMVGDPLIDECFREIDDAIRTRHANGAQIPKDVLEEIIAKSAP